MSVRDLIPWGRNNGSQVPSVLRDEDGDPFVSLHRNVNRLFDDVFRSFGSGLPSFGNGSGFRAGWPSVEISEVDKEMKVTAEVPGLGEKASPEEGVSASTGVAHLACGATSGRRDTARYPPPPRQTEQQAAEPIDSSLARRHRVRRDSNRWRMARKLLRLPARFHGLRNHVRGRFLNACHKGGSDDVCARY
jgi:hypothetical protein